MQWWHIRCQTAPEGDCWPVANRAHLITKPDAPSAAQGHGHLLGQARWRLGVTSENRETHPLGVIILLIWTSILTRAIALSAPATLALTVESLSVFTRRASIAGRSVLPAR